MWDITDSCMVTLWSTVSSMVRAEMEMWQNTLSMMSQNAFVTTTKFVIQASICINYIDYWKFWLNSAHKWLFLKTPGQHKTSVDLSGQSRDGNVTACSIIVAISSNPPWLSMWNIFISSCAVRIWVEEWLLLTCVSLCAIVYGNHLATYSTTVQIFL